MAKVSSSCDLSSVKDPQKFMQNSSQALKEIQNVINGNLDFNSNFKSQTVTASFSVANQDNIIKHNLAKTGLQYVVVDKNVACDIYHNAANDTIQAVCLRSSVAGASVSILLY